MRVAGAGAMAARTACRTRSPTAACSTRRPAGRSSTRAACSLSLPLQGRRNRVRTRAGACSRARLDHVVRPRNGVPRKPWHPPRRARRCRGRRASGARRGSCRRRDDGAAVLADVPCARVDRAGRARGRGGVAGAIRAGGPALRRHAVLPARQRSPATRAGRRGGRAGGGARGRGGLFRPPEPWAHAQPSAERLQSARSGRPHEVAAGAQVKAVLFALSGIAVWSTNALAGSAALERLPVSVVIFVQCATATVALGAVRYLRRRREIARARLGRPDRRYVLALGGLGYRHGHRRHAHRDLYGRRRSECARRAA
jgi:hypothetical protein